MTARARPEDNNTVLFIGYLYICTNPFIYATKFDLLPAFLTCPLPFPYTLGFLTLPSLDVLFLPFSFLLRH